MDKRTEEIKTHSTERIKADWAMRARLAGCNPSELLNDLICLTLYGETYGEHEAKVRREALTRQGLQQGSRGASE
jgi:hypothetical protein